MPARRVILRHIVDLKTVHGPYILERVGFAGRASLSSFAGMETIAGTLGAAA